MFLGIFCSTSLVKHFNKMVRCVHQVLLRIEMLMVEYMYKSMEHWNWFPPLFFIQIYFFFFLIHFLSLKAVAKYSILVEQSRHCVKQTDSETFFDLEIKKLDERCRFNASSRIHTEPVKEWNITCTILHFTTNYQFELVRIQIPEKPLFKIFNWAH